MKVRPKLILNLCLVLLSIIALSLILKISITKDTRLLLQNKLSDTKNKESKKILELNAAAIKGYAYDYSIWDQMVNFITVKKDLAWANEEIDLALANYKIDYAWVLDSNAKEHYYTSINKNLPVKGLSIPAAALKDALKANKFFSFFIEHNNGIVEIFTGSVQPTADKKRETVPKGFLLLGRVVDSVYMANLKNISPEINFSLVNKEKEHEDYINTKTGEFQFSVPLTSFNGSTLAAFNITKSYPVLNAYQKYLNMYLLVFIILVAVIGFTFYLATKKLLLNPLFLFSAALKQNNTEKLNPYNKKNDEIGDLARLITNFFLQKNKLEQEIETRKKTEVDLRGALTEKYTAQTERIKVEEFLEQQQAMLQLNINSPDSKFADKLKEIIALGARTIKCERVGIWLFDNKENSISAEHIYILSANQFVKGEVAYEKDYPNYFKHLKKEAVIIANDAQTDSATIEFAEEYLIPQGITSMLDVPIRNGNKVIGVVCYEHVGHRREWTISEQVFTRSLADIIALNFEKEERKKAEEKLYKNQVRFEETQELAQIGSWEVNFITQEVIWSKEMYRIFELENLPGLQLFEAYRKKIHQDDIQKFDHAINKLLNNIQSNSVECRVITKTGDIKYIRSIGEAIKSPNQGKTIGLRGTVQDITTQKQAAMAKSEFLSVMSHEIRTPINGVIGIANLLQDEELTERQKEYVNTLNFSAQHLSTVVSDILDFSKIESGHMSFERISFNLEKNCRYVYDLFAQKAAEKNIEFTFSFHPPGTENYSLYGDYVRLNQVLSNLLSNAIKFTEKGSVEFSYNIEDVDADKVSVSFSIKDSGIGISEKQRSKIFDSFTQADETITRQYGGTGLGLTISKKLVELQGGNIFVNSIEGIGTEFIVELSFDKHVYKDAAAAVITTAEKNRVTDLSGMKILVAEDNKVNAMVLTRFLTKWNIESKVAKDGAQALEMLENEHFDIVLMDIQMPNIDGIEATKLIRNSTTISYNNIPVVAFTADASVDTHRELLKIGFNHCMTKPFNPDTLFSFLKKNYKAA